MNLTPPFQRKQLSPPTLLPLSDSSMCTSIKPVVRGGVCSTRVPTLLPRNTDLPHKISFSGVDLCAGQALL